MADWTITANSNPSPYSAGPNSPYIRYFQESTAASTAVIKAGDIVSFDTVTSSASFRIVRAPFNGGTTSATTPVANLLNTTNVVGVAVEASTSDGSTTGLANPRVRLIGVAIAEPNADFQGYLNGDTAVAQGFSSHIGQAKAVRYDSTNHVYTIDSTNSTAALASIVITGIQENFLGDTNAPVIFKFLSTGVSPVVRSL